MTPTSLLISELAAIQFFAIDFWSDSDTVLLSIFESTSAIWLPIFESAVLQLLAANFWIGNDIIFFF